MAVKKTETMDGSEYAGALYYRKKEQSEYFKTNATKV